jgi:hypothetical protein
MPMKMYIFIKQKEMTKNKKRSGRGSVIRMKHDMESNSTYRTILAMAHRGFSRKYIVECIGNIAAVFGKHQVVTIGQVDGILYGDGNPGIRIRPHRNGQTTESLAQVEKLLKSPKAVRQAALGA